MLRASICISDANNLFRFNIDNQWSLNIDELDRSLNSADGQCIPKAIVVINPGNPTGSVLSEQNIKDIIKFAKKHKLLIIADEVYQHNVYDGNFFSFKKILKELDEEIELASVMSASKGYMGECGLRGISIEFGTKFHEYSP